MNAGTSHRAGPVFGACLVVLGILATFTPVVPSVAGADPTPDPSASVPAPSPTDAPTTSPTDAPTPAPQPSDVANSPSPGADPSPSPGLDPSASPAVDPSPSPSPDPLASPSPAPSGSPEPSPSVAPSELPSDAPSPSPSDGVTPLGLLPAGLPTLVDPSSPHVISGLTSDVCAACHGSHTASKPDLLSSVYRGSPLRLTGEAYAAADFALCWQCHSGTQQAAIEDTTGTATGTNFPLHGFHLKDIGSDGTGGTDITVPGAGQGNALCAECHDNLHATAADTRGLVKFAPDVEAYNGLPIAYDATTGTCTLTCHGVAHSPDGVPAPAAPPAAITAPAATQAPAPTVP
jgi:hypothetical protein